MSYALDLPDHLFSLMDALPRRTCATIHLMLARIAELAALWPRDDGRWGQVAYRDDQGLRFYVHGCCVRVRLEPESRRVVVCGVGRVRVHLSASELLDSEAGAEGSAAPQ